MFDLAFDANKGLIGIATSYSDGKYVYETIDSGWLQTDTVNSTPDQRQDLDSYVNAKGYLKRTVMEHTRTKWEANTGILYYDQVRQFIKLLNKGFKIKDGKCGEKARHCKIRYFNEWTDSYETGFFYVPDITFTYKTLLYSVPVYQPIRFSFIEL